MEQHIESQEMEITVLAQDVSVTEDLSLAQEDWPIITDFTGSKQNE